MLSLSLVGPQVLFAVVCGIPSCPRCCRDWVRCEQQPRGRKSCLSRGPVLSSSLFACLRLLLLPHSTPPSLSLYHGRPRSPARGRRRHRATLRADRARPAVVLALPLVHACRHCVHVDHTDGRTAAMVGNAMRPDRSHFGRCQNSFEVLHRVHIGIST